MIKMQFSNEVVVVTGAAGGGVQQLAGVFCRV